MKKVYTDEEMIEIAKEKNLELIDFDYIISDSGRKRKVANCICEFHKDKGVQQIKVESLRNSKKPCGYCNGTILRNGGSFATEAFQERLSKVNSNYKIISDYTGTHNRVKIRCGKCGHEWEPIAYSVLSGESRCLICNPSKENNRLSQKEFEDIVKERNENLQVLSNYKKLSSLIHFKCIKHDYEFHSQARNFIYKKSVGCPYCSHERGKSSNIMTKDVYQRLVNEYGYIFVDMHKENKNIQIDFICPIHEDKGVQTNSWSAISTNKQACKYCNGIGRGTCDFQKIVNEKYNGTIDVLGEYVSARNKIKVCCNIHNYTWEPKAYNLMSGFGCPLCGRERTEEARRLSRDEIKDRLDNLFPDITFTYYPSSSKEDTIIKCDDCGYEWGVNTKNLLYGGCSCVCPKCNISSGEKSVMNYLDNKEINYISQYRTDECKDKNVLPFDFYLPGYNMMIEFDGEHHYYPLLRSRKEFIGDTYDNYIRTIYHDELKNQYCKNKGILLIRIPYWERNNIDAFLDCYFMEKTN